MHNSAGATIVMEHKKSQEKYIYFGDKETGIIPAEWHNRRSSEVVTQEPFLTILKCIPFDQLFFLHQVHGVEGTVIDSDQQKNGIPFFSQDGDFLITNLPGVALGILTADCLPLIFFDPVARAVGIAHSGWKGAVAGIAVKTLEALQKEYGCQLRNIQVIFGPCARHCCYEVGTDFVDALLHDTHAQTALVKRQGVSYFDLPLYTSSLLQEYGIAPHAFSFDNAICTMCSGQYCSHRSDKGAAMRNVTLVSLK